MPNSDNINELRQLARGLHDPVVLRREFLRARDAQEEHEILHDENPEWTDEEIDEEIRDVKAT